MVVHINDTYTKPCEPEVNGVFEHIERQSQSFLCRNDWVYTNYNMVSREAAVYEIKHMVEIFVIRRNIRFKHSPTISCRCRMKNQLLFVCEYGITQTMRNLFGYQDSAIDLW